MFAFENAKTLELMYDMMKAYTHPEAWRFVAGGAFCKFGLDQRMPLALRQRLEAEKK